MHRWVAETIVAMDATLSAQRVEIEKAFESLAHGEVEERLLRCLALDVQNSNIDAQKLSSLVTAIPPTDRPQAILSAVTGFGQTNNPVNCAIRAATNSPSSPLVLVSALHGTKAVNSFRGGDTSEDAIIQLAETCTLFKGGRRPVTALVNDIRGNFPIVWVTSADDLANHLKSVTGNKALAVLNWMGLPYDPGTYHVFLLWYPTEFQHADQCVKPNSYAENWVKPGLYVSDGSNSSWGFTCQTTGGLGARELIHPTLDSLASPASFELEYLGKADYTGAPFAKTALDEARRRCDSLGIV